MSEIHAESRIGTGELLNPPSSPPAIAFEPGMRQKNKKKKKKKTVLPKPVEKSSDLGSSSNDEHRSDSDTSSVRSITSSSSSSSAPFSLSIADGPRYAEDPRDRVNRKIYDEKKDKRGRQKLKVVKVQRRDTSLDSFHSDLFAIEQFEKKKGTSKAMRRLWKAVKDLQKRVTLVENSEPGSSSEEEKRKKRKKRGTANTVKKESLVKVKLENDNVEDDKPLGAPTSLSQEGLRDGTTSEEPKDNKLARSPGLLEKEESDRKDTNTQKGEVEPIKPLGKEGKLEANDDEKVSDSDDGNSEYVSTDSEKQYTEQKFELEARFFLRSESFNSTDIYPFIRVRWDKLATNNETDTILVDAEQKDKIVSSHIDIFEILIDSPVFMRCLNELAYNSTVQPAQLEAIPPTGNPARGAVSFYKPFRWLIQNRERLQRKLKELDNGEREKKDNRSDPKTPSSTVNPELIYENSDHRIDDQSESDEYNLFEQLKMLLAFMDKHLARSIKKHEQARTGKLKGIMFEDLWMLFQPGDILYAAQRDALTTSLPPRPRAPEMSHGPRPMPTGPPIFRQGFGRRTPQAYKIIAIIGGRLYAALGPRGRKANMCAELKILCYYLDFNGFRFDCVTDTFTFRPFDNEISVTDLDAYPLAYASFGEAQGEDAMLRFLESRGRSFIEVTEATHKLYEGVAYSATKEEINTPVIIDFALAYQNIPSWQPYFNYPSMDYFNQAIKNPRAELFEIISRASTGRKVDWYWNTQVDLTIRARAALIETLDSYPTVGTTSSEPAIPKLISVMEANEHILLLPGIVHGFALRNRKWASLELTSLQDAQYEDGWNDLILPPGHKEMVRAVVENHATGSRSTTGMTKGTAEVDIVRGKGKGCIILLHGEPGVGKTSTAECVAAFTKRPLFPITCGDIGYEPDEVERNLEKHFNLAHKWGCVMLLDEADVFLAKRSREDIKRNGLVSVFLRILEYYPGILFLTTNRVGSFDDAFRSRLHLTLYYPKLDRKQTIQIFEMNLRRMVKLNSKRSEMGQKSVEIQSEKIIKFAKKHWETLSWNGRQIRNAFQTALALAEFDVRDGEEKQAIMSKKQFKTIAKASMEFDDYLFHTHGGTDESANARREQVRWDYEIKDRPNKKRNLAGSSSDNSSESDSSSSGSSRASEASDSDSSSSDSDDEKRRKRKKGKSKEKDRKSKKSESKSKKSKSKKDKHT